MIDKIKEFWVAFLESMKTAYSKVVQKPKEQAIQKYRDVNKINFVSIFIQKLNNLCNTEATFDVESDSTQAKPIQELCKDLESRRFNITSSMLADGDFWVFPSLNKKGELYHSYLPSKQVVILDTENDAPIELYGIIDFYTTASKTYFLLRHHKLENGKLTISYEVYDEFNTRASVEQWRDVDGTSYAFEGANHIGVGRYKSPTSSRGTSKVYGVPLNFGCAAIEAEIFNDLKLIDDEFENAKSKIFTDPRVLLETKDGYKIAENVIPISQRAGVSSPSVEIFNPTIRQSEHYAKLVADMGLYEKEIGTSKGILTDNEATETATATAVRRANADTLALLNKIRASIDSGNRMTLEADSMFLNIDKDLWSYSSDWVDPFADLLEQWKMLLEAKQHGAAEAEDLIRFYFTNLTAEEIDEKIERIKSQSKVDTEDALNRIIAGD